MLLRKNVKAMKSSTAPLMTNLSPNQIVSCQWFFGRILIVKSKISLSRNVFRITSTSLREERLLAITKTTRRNTYENKWGEIEIHPQSTCSIDLFKLELSRCGTAKRLKESYLAIARRHASSKNFCTKCLQWKKPLLTSFSRVLARNAARATVPAKSMEKLPNVELLVR